MIDKKELRVGNLLKHGDQIVTVEEIGDDGINICWNHEMTGWDYDYTNLYPIELSPEWMEKLGFDQNLGGYYMDIPNLGYIGYDVGILELGVAAKFPITAANTSIRYVHSLMNLYYSLTGEELTIKLP